MDYGDIFAPVARLATLRMLIAIAARFKMYTCHMDVVTAFLYGDVDRVLYMEAPEGVRQVIRFGD